MSSEPGITLWNIQKDLIQKGKLSSHFQSRTCYTRAERTDREIAKIMAEAGCYSVAMGVETGSHRDTESINKGESVNDYRKGIEILQEAGIEVHALIIFGFPEVTHRDIPMAAKFLLEAKPTISQFFIFHPGPGTEFFEEPEKHGLYFRFEKLEDWYKMDFIEEPICDTKHLTKEEIIKYFILYNKAFHCYESLGEDPELQQRLLRDAIPRKKKDVVTVRTGASALYSSPTLPQGFVYADMFRTNPADGHNVLISGYDVDHDQLRAADEICNEAPDVPGFSCYVWNIEQVLEICASIRGSLPQTKIVLGGPEVSARAMELMRKNDALDIVAVGVNNGTLLSIRETFNDLARRRVVDLVGYQVAV